MRIRFVILTMLAATTAQAQVGRSRRGNFATDPDGWFSFGAGYETGWSVTNGTQTWQFGEGPQYQASLEKTIASGVSLGVAATTARLPVTVLDVGSLVDADASVSQGFATLHFANAGAFHTAFDARAGATIYSSFASRTPGLSTGVDKTNTDFTFALAFGFGYAFNNKFSLDFVQDRTTIIHQDTGAGAGTTHSSGMFTTRVVARMGLGGR